MYQNVKRTCRVLFWLINPIVLWRSRCRRRRRRCLSSLISFRKFSKKNFYEYHTIFLNISKNPLNIFYFRFKNKPILKHLGQNFHLWDLRKSAKTTFKQHGLQSLIFFTNGLITW